MDRSDAPERISGSESDREHIRAKAVGETMGFSGHFSCPWIKVHYSFSDIPKTGV